MLTSCFDEELTLETSPFKSLYGGQITLSNQLIKRNSRFDVYAGFAFPELQRDWFTEVNQSLCLLTQSTSAAYNNHVQCTCLLREPKAVLSIMSCSV